MRRGLRSLAPLARYALRCLSATRGRSVALASVYALSHCSLAVGSCSSLAAYGLQVARVSRGL